MSYGFAAVVVTCARPTWDAVSTNPPNCSRNKAGSQEGLLLPEELWVVESCWGVRVLFLGSGVTGVSPCSVDGPTHVCIMGSTDRALWDF